MGRSERSALDNVVDSYENRCSVVPKFLGNCINLRESGDSEDPERTYPMKAEDKQEETIFRLNALGSL